MGDSWFTFSLPSFFFSFLSVVQEGVPFLLLGSLMSGLIDQFLPSRTMLRLLPRNPFMGICAGAAMGLVFPMCECGIVPVIRRLINKGLPLSNAIAYMLAAPIVNPLVIISTLAAFRGQHGVEFTIMRMGIGFLVAVLAAMAVQKMPVSAVLREGVIAPDGGVRDSAPQGSIPSRLRAALGISVSDFLDVLVFFVIGVAISSTFNTAVNQKFIDALASNVWLATFSMMGVAGILSLCSTSDAFIAATFIALPASAKLAFLIFGPMMDLKLVFIYSAVFKKRFVLGLAIGLFILVGLICVRMNITQL